MQLAIQSLKKNELGLNAASRIYGIPKAILRRRFKDINKNARGHIQIRGSACHLSPEVESALVKYILDMEACLFGFTPKDLRCLAFKFAEKYGLSHTFNRDKQIAGRKWYYNFMKRHSELSLRQPRATSFNRATGFNKEV